MGRNEHGLSALPQNTQAFLFTLVPNYPQHKQALTFHTVSHPCKAGAKVRISSKSQEAEQRHRLVWH